MTRSRCTTVRITLVVLLYGTLTSCSNVRFTYTDDPNQPPSLPYPWRSGSFDAENPEGEAYVHYLTETPLFPDQVFCEDLLTKRIDQESDAPASAQWTWVAEPYLAIGSGCCTAPGLFWSPIEAHVTYPKSGKAYDETFSCYVRYAWNTEEEIWREGKLKSGSCARRGHESYITCPASTPYSVEPGNWPQWEKGVFR